MFRLALFVLLGLATLPALAEPPENKEDAKWLNMPMIANCTTADELEKLTSRYSEIPIARGNGMILVPTSKGTITGELRFYASTEGESTYTMILMISEEVGCVIGMGNDFRPWNVGPSTQL